MNNKKKINVENLANQKQYETLMNYQTLNEGKKRRNSIASRWYWNQGGRLPMNKSREILDLSQLGWKNSRSLAKGKVWTETNEQEKET